MPFEFDDERKGSAGSFVFDDEQDSSKKKKKEGKSATDMLVDGVKSAKDFGLAIAAGAGAGVADLEAAAGTFIQAPVENLRSGMTGAAALVDRGVTNAANFVSPGSAQVNQALQETAQDQSAQAAAARERNVRGTPGQTVDYGRDVARMGKSMQDDGRERSASIQDFNRENNPELVAQQRAVSDAEGFVDTAKAVLTNPLALTNSLAQSAPGMAAGAGVAMKAAQLAGGSAKVAGMVGAGAEGATAAMQARESVYQQVSALPLDKLAEESPRYKEILAQVGNPEKARTALANELADQVPVAVGAGTVAGSWLTNKVFGGDKSAEIMAGGRMSAKDIPRNFVQEGTEEVVQGVPEDLTNYTVMSQADKDAKLDLGGSAASNFIAGGILGGGGSAGAYVGQAVKAFRSGKPEEVPPTPAVPPNDQGGAPVNASEVLGAPTAPKSAPVQSGSVGTSDTTAAVEALKAQPTDPLKLTNLSRMEQIDQKLAELPADAPERAMLVQDRAALTKDFPTAVPGNTATFSTESGVKLEGQYALMDADDLITSHDEGLRVNPRFPQELQPRERDRAASELQISGIVQRLDPARLGVSADAATGAPIVGADGLVESGNARTIALKRVYGANGLKAENYRTFLKENAAQFGVTQEAVEAMGKPVLVRIRTTPVNRAEFARQANASTVAQMSPSEQAKSDAARIDVLEDLNPDDNGDFSTSRDFIRRFVSKLPATEQGAMLDANGGLSSTGYTRVRNAVLAKAYGDSPVLARMVESMDDNLRNISKALMTAAPKVAQMRQAIAQGNRFDADITPDLVAAVEELSRLKDSGTSVADALAQAGMFGDQYSEETKQLLQFLADNIRRPRRMADFIVAYMEALDAAGDPNQGSLLGDVEAPAKGELLNAVKKGLNNDGTQNDQAGAEKDAQRGNPGEGAPTGEQGAGQPADASGSGRGDQGNGAAGSGQAQDVKKAEPASEWVDFPKDSGTIGIPRADMPQIKGEDRGALIQFLKARGIEHSTKEVPAGDLKPTQAEFSTKKAARWGEVRDGVDRSVLVSSDGHILDGHHQWVAALAVNEPIKAIVLDAPIRELMTNVFQFPSVKRSEGFTEQPAGRQARQDFKDAMADLADLLLDSFGGRAMMVPSNTPKLRETLVKLFAAAIEIVGTDLKAATKWVKDQLKANAETKPIWNKITDKEYQAAALEAMEQSAKERVDDLFSKAEKRQASLFDDAPAAPAVAMIDGRAYDMKRDNFKAPAVESFMDAGVLERADGYVAKYYKDRPPVQITEEERAKAEGLLTPLMEKAAAAKVEYDQKVIDIAKRTAAIGQMIAPLKGMKRSVEKLVKEEKFDIGGMKDMLRSTIVVSTYADAQAVLTEIEKEFKLLRKPKNRTSEFNMTWSGGELPAEDRMVYGGYSDVLVNVVMPNGVIAEIQINVPQMLAAKEGQGHKLYEAQREAPKESPLGREIGLSMTEFYSAAFDAAASRSMGAGSDMKTMPPAGAPARPGAMPGRGSNDSPSSDNLNQPSPGKSTNQSPPKVGTNSAPGGKLSGNLIATPLDTNVAEKSKNGYATGNLFGDSDVNTTSGQGSTQGEGATVPQGTDSKRKAGGTRARSVGANNFGDSLDDAGAAGQGEVGQPGAPGVRASDEVGGKPQSGKGAGRNAGVPAGPDIPAKSGRNYEFGPDDLTYEGSWPKKAEQNVEAVELLRTLEKEGRQATRDEQKILAKFIGWGSGELANNLFGPKLDKAAEALANFDTAMADLEKLGRGYLQKGGQYRGQYADAGYYQAVSVLRTAGKINGYEMPQRITREELQAAKPDASTQRWIALRDRLRAALTKEELAEASRSTQYAHYTSKGVVSSMWKAMDRMGFKGGHILEPGAGIGVFAGLMPQATAFNSSYTGIEFDSVTGGILKQLFPDERILVESFVDTKLPKNFYDVAIGNPPFSGTKILGDPEYSKLSLSLHDYFFAKSIDRVKPGGLVVYVTSRYTMDKLSDKARGYLADRADLVGAIRLPQTAFKQNAGTDVVTDVIFLRKKVKGETFEQAQAWSKSVPMKVGAKEFPVNEYFHAHPEMVLGTPSDTGKMQNSPDPQYTVLAPTGDIEELFAKAIEALPENIYQAGRGSSAEAAKVREIDFNPTAKKEGNFYVTDAGVLMQREGGVGQRVDLKSPKDAELIKDFVPLRDALKQAHYDQLNDGPWEESLAALKKAYAAFTKKNGQVNQYTSRTVAVKVDELDEDGNPTGKKIEDEEVRRKFTILEKLKDDPDWTLVAALETLNEDTGEIAPSAFLEKRVLLKQRPAQASTPLDAMLMTLNDIGKIDIPVIAQRVGLSEAETIEALGTAVYNDPEQGWVTADDYLSGNVKAKLDLARTAAKNDRSLERNVTALEANQPEPLNPSQIDPRMGMNWIPADVYAQFVSDITNGIVRANISFDPRTKHWTVEGVRGEQSDQATSEWGTPQRNMVDLMDHAVTGRPLRVMTKATRDTAPQFDEAATEAAKEKLEALHTKFSSWVFSDGARTDRLVRIYNDKFNTTKARQYDGKHLTLPGASTQFNIFNHVKRGAWRIIQSGNTYLAHAVGSGKTFQMVISAMEQKRLGLVQKPMVVVPNHMLKQFAHEWQQLYPAARLMVADEHNFHTDNRRRFVSRVALSDLDGVIITHSAFKLLDLDPEFKQKMIKEQLDYFRAALEEAGGDPDKLMVSEETDVKTGKVKAKVKGSGSRDPKIKRIEKQIENMEQKLLEATSSVGKDKNVRFDELGVDFLYVDEAHEYRKLDFTTKREVKGISPQGSGRAFDLYMKSRYLESKTPGRSLVLASGTPVTNTMAELYTVQRMLGQQALIDKGLEDFDSWASMFGREKVTLEPNAAGKYEPVARFQEFANVPELTQMFREFADVLTSDHLAEMLGDERPKVEGGARSVIITPETAEYSDFRKELEQRMEASKKWKPTPDEPSNPDPVIRIIGDGRLAAIDMRFMDPTLPSNPDSKLNRMIDDVIAAFNETKDVEYRGKDKKDADGKKIKGSGDLEPNKGSTLMVFSDLGFGAGVAQTRGFNARAWFEKRLRDAGIPADQVAFMSDYKKSSAKLKLFGDVNAGRVRILVGSSRNMGTGVNAQQRLKNLFHLDSPWYPADLEQREGRIIRTGNKNETVRIKAYAAKGTYDQQMWGQLANKQMFIDKAMSGDPNVRKIEDAGAADLMAMVSGMVAKDPRVLQLAGINAEIGKLQRLYQAHEDNRATFRGRFNEAQFSAGWNAKRLEDAKKVANQAQDLSGDKFTAKVGKSSYTERVKWAEALIAKYKDLSSRVETQTQTVGEISGFPIEFAGGMIAGQYRAVLAFKGPDMVELVSDAGTSPMGVAMRAQNAVFDIARLPVKLQERIAEANATMEGLRTKIEAQFPMLGMLSDKIKERDDLMADMASSETEANDAEPQALGADAFLDELDSLTFGNPLDDRERVTADFGIEISKVSNSTVHLHGLRSFKPGTGKGNEGLRMLMTLADKYQVKIEGSAVPFGNKGLNKKTLTDWYKRNGFTVKGESIVRAPKAQETPSLSRGAAVGGMEFDALTTVVNRITARMPNLPKVHVLRGPAEAPMALKLYIQKQGAWDDVEGAIHNGELYMFASGLSGALRAEHVLAEHEAAHFGLRGILGKDRTKVMNSIWVQNAEIRKAAAKLQAQGRLSNAEATEEALVDIPTAQLARLKGWRALVMKVRDFLADSGFEAMAEKLTRFLSGTLGYQQRADMMVADLVRAARAYAAGKTRVRGSVMDTTTALSDGVRSMAEDAVQQEKWLNAEARARGYADIDTLAEQNYDLFEKLAVLWRKDHPAETLLSRGRTLTSSPAFKKWFGNSKIITKGKTREELVKWEIRVEEGKISNYAANHLKRMQELAADSTDQEKIETWFKPQIEKAKADLEKERATNDAAKKRIEALRAGADPKVAPTLDTPKVMYHATDKAFSTFKPGVGGAIYLAPNPYGAEQIIAPRVAGDNAVKEGKPKPLFMRHKAYSGAYDLSGMNTLPVYVKAENPFDYENAKHVEGLAKHLESIGYENTEQIQDPDGAPGEYLPSDIRSKIGAGDYTVLESPEAQAWIKKQGHDGFYVTELQNTDDKNLAVYDSTQIKSAIGNNGDFDPTNPDISLSRAPAKKDPEERAETIIQTKAASRAPVDMMARMLTKVTGTERILGAVYDRAATLLDRYTPENIKAGIVSDYGVPEAVIDKRAVMQGNQRKQLRAAGSLIEKLATLTREESRVAYEWMNMDGSDPRAYMSMLQGLPEESVKVLTEVQQLIDQLSQEAMRLGQLSPEAYKANRFAYLRRSYVKHTAELTTGEAKKRARAITVLGDQYKGRGMTDAANMNQIQNLAPEWWKRKLQAGKADASLKGEKFVRLERRAASGEGVKPLEGMTGKAPGKLLEIAYYPAGEKLPAKYQDWNQAGEWTVRDVKGGNLVMWRDFTKSERETMGEIDEARFAIAKTLHGMINDVEVGRYLEWLGQTYAKVDGDSIPGTVVEASERMRDTFKPGDWVKVPETKISGTNVYRYGKLAGRYLPGPIWNDLRQVVNGQFMPLGETYANLLRLWKTSKTALSPAVHTNNIMSNFVMADWHDVSAGHMAKALRILLAASKGTDRAGMGGAALRAASTLGRADIEASKAIVARYQDSGGDIGGWATQEIRDEQLKPLLDMLEKELAATAGNSVSAQVGVFSALQHALMLRLPSAYEALKGGKRSGKVVGAVANEANNLIDLYQSEDDVFRLAAWLKAKEEGRTDLEAGKASRESFLDYRVNAPWIQAMRQTGWPFISFTYRAVPMFLETAAKRPHKLMKLMLLAGALNALGVLLSGGDDDKERKLLPEEKAGRIWGMVPKLIRMPWNDQHGSAVYLDIRRFIPVGDVFDVGAGHSAVPMLPGLTPGGPLVLAGELVLNKSAFTGKAITLETDTGAQQAGKVFDYLYKAFAPNLLGLPGTYATTGVMDAANGRTDAFGREMSVTQALSSSFGMKLGSYPVDVLRRNAKAAAAAQISEIDKNIAQLKRQRQTNRISAEDFQSQVTTEQEKKRKVMEDLAKKM